MNNTVVVDTNIIISALISSKGTSREVLKCCLNGAYKPLISNALFLEYEDVSYRAKTLSFCSITEGEIRKLLNAFYSICNWTSIHYLWRPNVKDEGDNFLVELAVAGNASCIITNNTKDFTNSELVFPNIQIVTPEQILRG